MIFKSRQVNLDPEPLLATRPDGTTRRFAADEVQACDAWATDAGDWELDAPRPEFDVTRDPWPWVWNDTNLRTGVKNPGEFIHWAPRRDQYDTPINPILVAFREDDRSPGETTQDRAFWYLVDLDRGGLLYTPDQIDHARRVLTRLAEVTS